MNEQLKITLDNIKNKMLMEMKASSKISKEHIDIQKKMTESMLNEFIRRVIMIANIKMVEEEVKSRIITLK